MLRDGINMSSLIDLVPRVIRRTDPRTHKENMDPSCEEATEPCRLLNITAYLKKMKLANLCKPGGLTC
ncbi:unnamed protein product [Pleuronectes platessa]|uniref:Uncharacterized protein n=1 Tax=Pleuronectes platessa TaxID=8262 RepID=A0A9N7VBT8_PLEPL|nr:unnamed protein product [Pleuronectes platessa]